MTNALCSPAVAALFREVDKPAPTFLAGDLPRRFRFAYLRGKRAAHGAGNPWNRQFRYHFCRAPCATKQT